ncbi:Bug family tripartite tricarboxylate transporter substrate binding protein [Sabulicella rubraurantiaca]|uniref:Bug family tripartite tricarboxylate transporter substrate binding protein n=1 Tax=Sabulicella rubraurantiaca TaxID=2811429 RepID=UPI001A9785DF|nr:tripartite tricarboxylate transporter substrate binding protein [Sabulicella rubraurantiaca]
MTLMHLPRRGVLTAALAGIVASPALAQSWPDRPIRLVAPFPPGGLADVLARTVSEEMARSLGQPVIVENRTGAGGNVGAEFVTRAAPDGHTLMMSSTGILSANQFLYPSLPFDPESGFAPVSLVADMTKVLVVHPRTPARTLAEFRALAAAEPGRFNFGSAGNGTTGHLGLALFTSMANLRVTHVPYRGAAPSVQALLAGEVDGLVDNIPNVVTHIRSGAFRPLVVASKEPHVLLPDVPSSPEAGLPGYEMSPWFGVVGPAGMPPPVVERLHREIVAAIRQPGPQAMGERLGLRFVANTPSEFDQVIRAERARWGRIIREAGITLG